MGSLDRFYDPEFHQDLDYLRSLGDQLLEHASCEHLGRVLGLWPALSYSPALWRE